MATLHIIAHALWSDDRLDSCLRILGAKDALLLCGEAVSGLRPGSETALQLRAAQLQGRLFALQEDLYARAISQDYAKGLDYPGFVELSLYYDKVNSWL
ncbi:sulfurtransferase complex subunit TusB [Pseudomonas phoenicis]|uniref:sulfurtransferase complex subunit TusB n=1 Tax=unclassified Pseudomonas TaxID=196821 RepID=UPI0039A1D9D4